MDKATQEVWRAIPGHVGLYEVSNLGNVRSFHNFGWRKRKEPRSIKTCQSRKGYVQVTLCKDTRHKTMNVHQLVAAAFLPIPPHGMQLDHINGNKADNSLANLEWVTPKENTLRALAIGLKPTGERHGMSKITLAEAEEIRQLYKTGKYSHRKLGLMFGLSHCTVGKICRYEAWRKYETVKAVE